MQLRSNVFELAAAQGSSEAHFQLGVMYMTGLGVERQLPKAFQEFNFASLQGHTRALFNVAQMQTFGIGTLKSCSVGLNLMKVVAERGPWATVLTEAHQAFLDGEYDQAWLLYALAGLEGYETGLSNAAWMIDHGLIHMPSWGDGEDGLTTARQIAYELYEYSAAQNNVESMRRMGDFVWYGWAKPTTHNKTAVRDTSATDAGSETDAASAATASSAELEQQQHALAAKQYERAGEHGDAESWFNLGYQYQYGIGVNRDLHLSKRYYDRAVLTDPKAWLPTKLALITLSFDQFIFDHFTANEHNAVDCIERSKIRARATVSVAVAAMEHSLCFRIYLLFLCSAADCGFGMSGWKTLHSLYSPARWRCSYIYALSECKYDKICTNHSTNTTNKVIDEFSL